jgi:hypothetical protein
MAQSTTEGLTMKDAIGYLRASTQEQGRSGLGPAAQRQDIDSFGEREGFKVKSWYQDIQAGAGKDALLLLIVHPVALGRGQPLFSALRGPVNLRLISATSSFGSGVVGAVHATCWMRDAGCVRIRTLHTKQRGWLRAF